MIRASSTGASTESIALPAVRKPPKRDQADTKTFSGVRAPVLDHDRVSQGPRERGPRAGPPPPPPPPPPPLPLLLPLPPLRHTCAGHAAPCARACSRARLVVVRSSAERGYSAKVRSETGGGRRKIGRGGIARDHRRSGVKAPAQFGFVDPPAEDRSHVPAPCLSFRTSPP